MKYFYGEYDGSEFPSPDNLFGFDQLMNFIMQYGEQALKARHRSAIFSYVENSLSGARA